eukprot:TRINITY_DN20198_c0_g1_i1.p1 TRINITY_DN20198_c0_g1~~TRINITY_DN20198_c0_g1_i1.p1  ORF type:complete len:202 (-),score=6.10 TRINITY_DN20198_c0_g1_i1:133-738(-)
MNPQSDFPWSRFGLDNANETYADIPDFFGLSPVRSEPRSQNQDILTSFSFFDGANQVRNFVPLTPPPEVSSRNEGIPLPPMDPLGGAQTAQAHPVPQVSVSGPESKSGNEHLNVRNNQFQPIFAKTMIGSKERFEPVGKTRYFYLVKPYKSKRQPACQPTHQPIPQPIQQSTHQDFDYDSQERQTREETQILQQKVIQKRR